MIASIRGEVISRAEDSLVVEVGGVGFLVHAAPAFCRVTQVGETIFLHTYLVVRQDALILYGFETEELRNFFILLLGVNGVGPRTSLSIVSTLSIDVMRKAVLSEQADAFARVPGVGKKTAQKILLHLQGKVSGELSGLAVQTLDVNTEVLEALTGLGYSVVEAQAALQSMPRATPADVETRIRLALQYFSS
ncbi:MAG: Holliday junction branch migration protein RuvA [Anaerolineaceae bacterium]|jgi:Holliday junction DNA helicase RuvA